MIKFDIKVKRHVYGDKEKTEVTFIVDNFNDVINMFKLGKNNDMIRFLTQFKIYNPNIGEGGVNGKITL